MRRTKKPKKLQQKPQEQVKFWRDPVLRDLEMLRATYVDYSFSRHAHEGFGIAIVESGAMKFEYQGAVHTAPAGSIVVTHPGEMHTGQAVLETGWTYRTLLPAIDWLQQATSELTERRISSVPYFPSPVIHNALLNRQMVALHRVLEKSPSALERESRFLWGLSQLVRGYASDRPAAKIIGKEHQAVQKIRDYLRAYYAQNIALSELSAQVGLKPLRLLRAFKAEIGLPPHAYLTQVRVYRAKRLLAAGWSIAAAAVETGFVDQSHLHRHFKKIVGVTPGQYVRGCKNVQD
ncbi:AraC family transcriptional regulator [cf. Phormidesmis sp. LEGE 11477]|uniref:AraC family transcriptional regulator n=1 Tax=cf. Phormidesmis sp. LEGE 11477 TaxID=1828680 RepID=UPI0018820288|nr:AraC family transcriptional regulator [cf. Phormidesmis sp. LEGE 11477]MBE9059527.1 AraC family transcriptional regulator [cf. Phormidesmis sp. LEGE 11477]